MGWDEDLEKALSAAERELDRDDFEAALEHLRSFMLPTDAGGLGDPVSIERMAELRQRYDALGQRMKRAQDQLQATMARSGNSRRAARAYGA